MSTRLFVGNLSYATTEQDLRDAFSQGGRTVDSVRVAIDRQTQRPRGFAFIEMAKEQEADAAIQQLNQSMLGGRTIFVEKAQDRPPLGQRPAGGGFSRPPSRDGRPDRPRGEGGGFSRPGPGGGGFSRPGGAGPGGGGFSRPRPAPGPGGFGRGPGWGAGAPPPGADDARRKAAPAKRKVKEKKSEGRPEQRERGKWRWDREEDY